MSFLDRLPQDWTRPELPQLRDLFVLAYRRELVAEQLADSAGIVPGTFPHHDNMRVTWTELITVMGQQGKLRTLVEKASVDATIGPYKSRFAEMLQAKPSVPTTASQKDDSWWKGHDEDQNASLKLHYQRQLEQRSRLFSVDLARQVARMSGSVAKLNLYFEKETAYGTGFLIQPDRLLTNEHNFSSQELGDVVAVTAEFDYESGFSGTALVCKGKVETIKKDAGNDWAVIQLEKPVDRKPLSLGSPFQIRINDPVVVIQHPLGSPKQFALDHMSIRYVDDERIQYLADTQKGSSGSPVFDIRMQVIALHHAEAELTLKVDGQAEETIWHNEGIAMKRVMKDLMDRGIEFVEG